MKEYRITYITGRVENKRMYPNDLTYLVKQSMIPVASVKIIKENEKKALTRFLR